MERQHIFFVATAPLSAEGHINCSPKGGETFRVIDDREVAYLDYTGSGAETIAHIRENGRIVVMFCAFDGKPNIVRVYGQGSVLTAESPEFITYASRFPDHPALRSIIRIAVDRVSETCGFAVPLMEFKEERTALTKWAISKGPEALSDYREEKNAVSIDGLPALEKLPSRTMR
jgi:hypothetical protein